MDRYRAFKKFKFRTQVEYNTKPAHYINVKLTNSDFAQKAMVIKTGITR